MEREERYKTQEVMFTSAAAARAYAIISRVCGDDLGVLIGDSVD